MFTSSNDPYLKIPSIFIPEKVPLEEFRRLLILFWLMIKDYETKAVPNFRPESLLFLSACLFCDSSAK